MLHEQLKYEGPQNVAAIMVEGVTGTNGLYRHPKGYLEACCMGANVPPAFGSTGVRNGECGDGQRLVYRADI